MQYGTQSLTYKLNITKVYFKRLPKFIYNEIVYLEYLDYLRINFYQPFFITERALEKQLSVEF